MHSESLRQTSLLLGAALAVFVGLSEDARSQGRRILTAIQSPGLSTLPASVSPGESHRSRSWIEGDRRIIESNGIPEHAVGVFPNSGNPHRITAQQHRFRVPAEPTLASRITPLRMQSFGVAVNGVPFDPGAAEWFGGHRHSHWQYEALSGAVPLGIDANHAHVQPSGAYHYHGLPSALMDELGTAPGHHSPIGWAADGFPIYALYGEDGSERTSSYRLRDGNRPSQSGDPGGIYDGTFVADYVYEPGRGDLDECNGTTTFTREFPNGTYAYFLTREWPVIPRCFAGQPATNFEPRRGVGRPRPGRPPRPHGGPPRRG